MRTAAALLLSLSPIALAGNAFYALGVSDPGFESFGWAVSDDGSTVVGYELGGDSAGPFFWTAADGVTLIHSLEVDLTSAVGVSADGAVLVGNADLNGRPLPWRWDRGQSQEIELLPLPFGYTSARASGVSADGEAIGGTAISTMQGGYRPRPFRWTLEQGSNLLATPDQPGEAYAISADGEFVTGGAFVAFLWNTMDGFQPLPAPPDADVVYAYALSDDGSIQAGEAFASGLADAIVWDEGVYSILPPLPGAGYSAVYAISGDGQTFAGRSSATGLTGYNAAVWDEQRRVINLNDYVDSIGIHRDGLRLTFIRGLSHDGRVLAGWGERDIGEGETRREAWVAVLDMPMSCAADVTLDHRVDFADLNLLLSTFGCQTPDCAGDVNADGRVDFADLNEVLVRFGLVCINPAGR